MKILKITLGIIALLVIGFFLMGVFTPEVNYTTEVEVNKPVKEAWGVFMDESKADQWLDGYLGSEMISGNANEVGAVAKIRMEHEGEVMEMNEEITAFKEFEQHAMTFTNEAMVNHVDVRFAAKGDNTTTITTATEFIGQGAIMRSMFALMKGSFKPVSEDMNAKLKKLIEENTTDYYPEPVLEAEAISAEAAAEEAVQ